MPPLCFFIVLVWTGQFCSRCPGQNGVFVAHRVFHYSQRSVDDAEGGKGGGLDGGGGRGITRQAE